MVREQTTVVVENQPQTQAVAPVETPVAQTPTVTEVTSTPSPRKFDNLYLDPQPADDSKDTVSASPPIDTTVKDSPTYHSPARSVDSSREVFHKPELPPISYSKRAWVLHQHEDLQPRINTLKVDIQSQAHQRASLLANELLFFEQVNQAEKSLRDKMLREDQRQHDKGVCWAYRLAVTECLKAGRNCTLEITGWKKCEEERN